MLLLFGMNFYFICVYQVYKEPLEEMVEREDCLLTNTEIKIIFGNVLPIYQVHLKMLEELKCFATSWQEDNSIGNVFLKYVIKQFDIDY